MNTPSIKRIVILGGGSAGWLTAGIIAAEHCQEQNSPISITLIESPDIPIIGVGEGTWPTMRQTLRKIGISESTLFRECDASFKQGTRFINWATGNDAYYHPLVQPHGFHETDIASAWLSQQNIDDPHLSFAHTSTFQSHLCDKGLAPKQITTPEYAAVANYAYHLDAVKLSQLLRKHCTESLNVKHVLGHIESVTSHLNGDIQALVTKTGEVIEGDLFIDCSGLRSRLLGEHYRVPFIDKKSVLFNDKAIAVQIPYAKDKPDIASCTLSTAQQSGWIWDIGLPTRKGLGMVYSSDFSTHDEALQTLQKYVEASGISTHAALEYRALSFAPGHRAHFWHNNCVAIGLSAGFLEPLEASALVLVESSAEMLAKELPVNREMMSMTANRFNNRMRYYWNSIIDFLKLHYVISQRQDSPYWIEHTQMQGVTDSLKASLDLWQYQTPNQYDFPYLREMFPEASWQYVLYGMKFNTHVAVSKQNAASRAIALKFKEETQSMSRRLESAIPKNRDLIEKICLYGLHKV